MLYIFVTRLFVITEILAIYTLPVRNLALFTLLLYIDACIILFRQFNMAHLKPIGMKSNVRIYM